MPKFRARAMRLLAGSKRESVQAELELVRLGALNASVQSTLQETSKAQSGQWRADDDFLVKQFPPLDAHIDVEAQLKELKLSLGKSDPKDQGGGQYFAPPFPSGPDDPARVPRRPLPKTGGGEIALPLPEAENQNPET